MDKRFASALDRLLDHGERGPRFATALRRAATSELVAALATARLTDAVAANAIATELLNRVRRGPLLGAFYVSLTTVVAIYVLDYVFTGTFLLLEEGTRARILVGISLLIAAMSGSFLAIYRGLFPRLRRALLRGRSDY